MRRGSCNPTSRVLWLQSYAHTHTWTHTYTESHTLTHKNNTLPQKYPRTNTHTEKYTHVHTHTHIRTHTYTHVHTRTHTYTHVHTRTQTYTHTPFVYNSRSFYRSTCLNPGCTWLPGRLWCCSVLLPGTMYGPGYEPSDIPAVAAQPQHS